MTFNVAYQQASAYTAAQDRRLMQAGMMMANRTTVRAGILPAVDDASFKPYFATGLTVQVYGGTALVAPDYRVNSDSTVSVAIAAGDPAARTDLIVLRVYETEAGDAANSAAVEVIKGTSAAVPPTPARALALATVAVPANAGAINASAVTDVRVFTSSVGGVLRVPGVTSPLPAVPSGTIVYDPTDDDFYLVRNGGVPVPLGATGSPYLYVGGISSQALNAVYKFTSVISDTHGKWDLANGRYTVPVTGYYFINIHTKCGASGGYDEPSIQVASSVAGTYANKITCGNPTNAPYNSMTLSATLLLNANTGIRVWEGGGAWTGYNDPSPAGSNYFQMTFLGSA